MICPLQIIPGVGPSIAEDFQHIGITTVAQLKGRDPEKLYQAMMEYEKQHIDRCMLYVLRCAVYFAGTPQPDPEKLKWWNWKD